MDPDFDQQDDNVTGVSEDLDFSQFGVEEQAPAQATTTEEIADNPKWSKFLEVIPGAFHNQVKPLLKEWDQGVNQRFQQIQQEYAPYKQFKEQNIPPERLLASHDLAQRLATDPVGFYEELKSSLVARGRIQEAQQVQAQQDALAEDDPNADDPYLQKLTALERQVQERDQALVAFMQEQQQIEQQQAMLAEENANIEAGFQQVESKIGPMSDPFKRMVLEKAMIMNQQTGRAVTIPEAANEVIRTLNAARRTTSAPRTIPTGGSVPHTPVADPANMSKQERFAAAEAIRRRYENQ